MYTVVDSTGNQLLTTSRLPQAWATLRSITGAVALLCGRRLVCASVSMHQLLAECGRAAAIPGWPID